MTMSDDEPNMPALRREWRAAQIVGAAGGLLVLLVLGALVVMWLQSPVVPTASVTIPVPDQSAARHAEGVAICAAAVAEAQATHIVPDFARPDGGEAASTQVQGRYVCGARTDAANYQITFDLGCTRLGTPGCIGVYAIAQDGTVLYRRK